MITSNLKSVIARLEAYQAGLPGCVERSLAVSYWGPALRMAAEKALRAQFALFEDVQTRVRYEKLLPRILDTLAIVAHPGSVVFQLSLPAETLSDVNFRSAAQYAGLSWTPMGRQRKWAMPDVQGEANLAAARQAVLDWVTMEKQLDERDAGKSMQEIAERVEMVLGLRPALKERTEAMDAAAEQLRGAIEAWLMGDGATPSGGHNVETPSTDPFRNQTTARSAGLTNAQARSWLESVLQTWLVFFRIHWRDRMEAELAKLHRSVQARQGTFKI